VQTIKGAPTRTHARTMGLDRVSARVSYLIPLTPSVQTILTVFWPADSDAKTNTGPAGSGSDSGVFTVPDPPLDR